MLLVRSTLDMAGCFGPTIFNPIKLNCTIEFINFFN